MTRINVMYAGGFNPELDQQIHDVVGHESVSAGFMIPTGERDIQFDVPDNETSETIDRLKAIGVKAERPKPIPAHSGVYIDEPSGETTELPDLKGWDT